MWQIVLDFCALKVLWMFIFVVFTITTFLMVMYNAQTEELKKSILTKETYADKLLPLENRESMDRKLRDLSEKLTEKEQMLKRSQCEIKNVEKVLDDMETKTSSCRSRYKLLMIDLKKDVKKTEQEVKMLQNQVSTLSLRREELRNEVLKQQEDYQRILHNFTKELESKEILFLSGIEKSRHHPYRTALNFRSRIS